MAGAMWNWCHLGKFCVHHTTMHHVTLLMESHIQAACVFSTFGRTTGIFYMLLQYHGVKQDTEIRVHKESWRSRKKCSRCSCWDLNQRPFDHESDTVTIELSPLPMTQTLNTAIQSFYKTLKIMMMYHQGMFGDFWSTQMSVAQPDFAPRTIYKYHWK